MKEEFKIPYIITTIIIMLSVVASVGGLLLSSLYNDNEFVKIVWKSNDLLTLILVIPIMILVLVMYKRSKHLAQIIWMGTLGYMIYNYIFYLYGASFNYFFLIYVFLFTFSTYALILMLLKTNADEFMSWFSEKVPAKRISIFMFSFAVVLGGMWIGISVSYVITNVVPMTITQTGHPTSVVFATDLSFLISGMVVSGILLWKKNIWGYIFSSIVLFKATTYGLVLIVMTIIMYVKTGLKDPILPLYIFLWLGSLISLISLLKRRNPEC
ncbi:hypothetical protein [Vallitalea okinawensis]|uniref:hypothetical protein n=1 Tax=Vallitalea okinawensis TaxID=2078660 RepID=UPI000CFD6DAF|nr:hypothetical protein [Vallitalea okinawensis]